MTRKDIHPGSQSSQLVHAVVQFGKEHFEIQNEWFNKSNHIVLLSCENEESLKKLILRANIKDIKSSVFTEPDLNNELTAVAFEPCEDTCKLVSNLPLAFKEYTITFKQFQEKEVANGN